MKLSQYLIVLFFFAYTFQAHAQLTCLQVFLGKVSTNKTPGFFLKKKSANASKVMLTDIRKMVKRAEKSHPSEKARALYQAAKKIKEFKELFPNNLRYRSIEVDILVAQEKYVEAYQKIDEALGKNTSSDVFMLIKKASLLKKQGRLHEALEAYMQVVKQEPNNAIGLSQAGHLMFRLRQYDEAVELLDHAQKVEPDNRQVYWNRLQARLALKDIKGLQGHVARLEGGEIQLYVLAALDVLNMQYKQAINRLVDAPLTPAFLRLRAQAYFQTQDYQKAYSDLVRIVQMTEYSDYFTIAALIRIEMIGSTVKDYRPSPMMKIMLKDVDMPTIATLVQMDVAKFWSFSPQTALVDSHSLKSENFWGDVGYRF